MLTNAEKRFKSMFDQSPLGIQLISKDGRTLQVNKTWVALWQTSDGKCLKDYMLSSEWNIFTDVQLETSGITSIVRRVFAGESIEIPPFLYDAAQLGTFGRARWISGYAHPVLDCENRVQEVMMMYEDVSERIYTENTLRQSEQRFRSLIKATAQIVWTTSAEGAVEEDSPTWREFTGQTYEEWKQFGWLNVIHPADQVPTLRLWTESVETRSMYQAVYRLLRLDGEYRWTTVRAVPVLNDDGNIREWVGTNIDIHDIKTNSSGHGTAFHRQDRRFA